MLVVGRGQNLADAVGTVLDVVAPLVIKEVRQVIVFPLIDLLYGGESITLSRLKVMIEHHSSPLIIQVDLLNILIGLLRGHSLHHRESYEARDYLRELCHVDHLWEGHPKAVA